MSRLKSLLSRVSRKFQRKIPPDTGYGEVYANTTRQLTEGDSWPEKTIQNWQLGRLNNLLRYAVENCPGHANKLRAAGYPGVIEDLSQITTLPFFTKEELRTNSGAFTSATMPAASLRAVTSGGTTGEPVRFMVEEKSYDAVFDAWRHAMWRRAGFTPGSRCLDLTWAFNGDPLRPAQMPASQYLSIHALDASQLESWWSKVVEFQPNFIIGFPSTAVAFVKSIPDAAAMKGIKAFLLASEALMPDQSAILANTFQGVRVFQWYGMSELAGFASGCEYADTFHHWPQSGLIELIGENEKPVCDPGKSGEIVLTGFLNLATPFIRYRTGDRGVLGSKCPQCRRPHIILQKIDGRLNEHLIGKHGRLVPLSALNFHGDEFLQIFAHQFIQDEPGIVRLILEPVPGNVGNDFPAIERMVSEKLGPDIFLNVECVEKITRTARGKQPLIIQRCKAGQAGKQSPAPLPQ